MLSLLHRNFQTGHEPDAPLCLFPHHRLPGSISMFSLYQLQTIKSIDYEESEPTWTRSSDIR